MNRRDLLKAGVAGSLLTLPVVGRTNAHPLPQVWAVLTTQAGKMPTFPVLIGLFSCEEDAIKASRICSALMDRKCWVAEQFIAPKGSY